MESFTNPLYLIHFNNYKTSNAECNVFVCIILMLERMSSIKTFAPIRKNNDDIRSLRMFLCVCVYAKNSSCFS